MRFVISVGSVVALSGVLCADVLVGLVNGLVVTRLGVALNVYVLCGLGAGLAGVLGQRTTR